MPYVHETEMTVRDYECDLQGIVNNAVYQHYLEHARHEFLHEIGFDFDQLCAKGIDAVVTRIEIDYKKPLRPRDIFRVRVGMRRQGRLRVVFDQAIVRQSDEQLMAKAAVTAVLMSNDRPIAPDLFVQVFKERGWALEAS